MGDEKCTQFQQVGNKRREASCLTFPILSFYSHRICISLRNSHSKGGVYMSTPVHSVVTPLQDTETLELRLYLLSFRMLL